MSFTNEVSLSGTATSHVVMTATNRETRSTGYLAREYFGTFLAAQARSDASEPAL